MDKTKPNPATRPYFFCGIGGSGMLPLAMILRAQGATVAGSDRSLDQGRTGAKFDWLAGQGIALFPQDGSGVTHADQLLVASAAVEDSVPDVARARELGCERLTRAEVLARLFNAAPVSIGIGGTSGKSTVTAMTGWIAHACGAGPTIMNGAVMKNFAGDAAPFTSSVVGSGDAFISELDESDGSIALFDADVAVVTNVTLDHKPLAELRDLFAGFADRAGHLVWNADDAESAALFAGRHRATSFGFADAADVRIADIVARPFASDFTLHVEGAAHAVHLPMPGRHNAANAAAAVAAAVAAGIAPARAAAALADFAGIRRRFERVGEARGVTVIDDFGHNPDKVAATLATLADLPGRMLLLFQPHGYGPLRTMGAELADAFAAGMRPGDRLAVSDPVYFGGTVARGPEAADLAARVASAGHDARHIAARDDGAAWLAGEAQAGDAIVVMGARDDTLPAFATHILHRLS